MIKKLASHLGEYKRSAIVTPLLSALEAIMDILLPTIMAFIIDQGIEKSDMNAILKYGLLTFLVAAFALLLGVLGGRRLEHTLANLCTGLGLEQRGVRATLLDERSRITFVMPGETRRYPRNEYFYLSVFPMEGRAEGVSERGSFYELTDATLTAGYPLGVSNEYAEGSDCITISTQKGALVVVETVPDGPILS